MNQSVSEDEDAGICADCGYPLTPVRPGKAQCDYCELLAVYDQETYDHQKTREALNALIEENDKLQGELSVLIQERDIARLEWDELRAELEDCRKVIASQRQLLCEHGLAEYGN